MQSEKIPSAILNAAALLLQPYLPDLTPQKLETALAAKEKNAGELDLSRKLTRAECARILGVSVNSVHRLHSEWLFAGDQYQSPSGANRSGKCAGAFNQWHYCP